MKQFDIKILEGSGARLPQYPTPGHSGFLDIFAGNKVEILKDTLFYHTGLVFNIDAPNIGIVYPRNDLYESGMVFLGPNIIEFGNDDELVLKFKLVNKNSKPYGKMELIGKMIVLDFEPSVFNVIR